MELRIEGNGLGAEQNCTIYAYDSDCLKPLGINSRINKDEIFQQSCAIIEHNGNKYVCSTRSSIIRCKKIILIYGTDSNIYQNELCVIFQSIETNIVILGTIGHPKLKLELSTVIKKNKDNISTVSFPEINPITITDKFTNPRAKKNYYGGMVDIDIENDIYNQNIYKFVYIKSNITDHVYLPSIWVYEFELAKKNKSDLSGLCGSLISTPKKKIIGIVTSASLNTCIVLPTRHLYKIVSMCFDQSDFCRSLRLPIGCSIKKNKKKSDLVVDWSLIPEIKSRDKIISVDNKEISVDQSGALIYDEKYKEYIPLDIYLRLNLNPYSMMNIALKRNKKNISYDLRDPIEDHMLKLTDQADFVPTDLIPFYNLKGLIIVQFTHELIDIFAFNKIKLNNRIVDKFMDSVDDKRIDKLFVVSDISKKKKIQIKLHKSIEYDTLDCFELCTINGTGVSILSDIKPLVKTKENVIVVSLIDELTIQL